MRKSTVLTMVVSATLVPFSSQAAEPAQNEKVAPWKFGGLEAQEIIKNNMTRGSEDDYVIPGNVYYRFIFEEILSNGPEDIAALDWRLIEDLPSHNDDRFLAEVNRDIGVACSSINIGSAPEVIASAALLLDETTRNYEAMLDKHYLNFVASLSSETQTMIQKRVREMAETKQVGYARLRFSGVAAESHELAADMMLAGCSAYKEHGANYVGQHRKLKDEEQVVFSFDELK